ncbi:rab-like protein 6 [Dendrobium catenatum]|uniref:rab-like protein 6 n=1 Tax=Dendrobium catenatum TaxID=906689 RepID=UPI0009F37E9C|nr:rab-like protein 6 [Dendrobium catenatum]
MSFVSPSPKLSFKGDDLSEHSSIWSLALVGYSLGQRPYYERLLSAMKKLWVLKGKPFILQRWSPKFKHVRDEAASIMIWVKIVDLPLDLWTPTGIFHIASYIGIPLTVDSLTANRTRLTFARVCIQISKDSKLPKEIPIQIEEEDMLLKVVYEWKPSPCEGCGSLIHPFSLCPSNPNLKPILHPPPTYTRGRSFSRNPSSRQPGSRSKPPVPTSLPSSSQPSIPLNGIQQPSIALPSTSHSQFPFASQQPSPPPPLVSGLVSSPMKPLLPNLNAPSEDLSSSVQGIVLPPASPSVIPTGNKFASLQSDDISVIPPPHLLPSSSHV